MNGDRPTTSATPRHAEHEPGLGRVRHALAQPDRRDERAAERSHRVEDGRERGLDLELRRREERERQRRVDRPEQQIVAPAGAQRRARADRRRVGQQRGARDRDARVGEHDRPERRHRHAHEHERRAPERGEGEQHRELASRHDRHNSGARREA